MVVAVAGDSPAESVKDLPNGVRVQTEYLESTRRYFEENGIEANIRLSYGATEAKIPDIADCVVEITETGRALKAAGLKVIDVILTSYTEVVANPAAYADPEKRKAMEQVMTLLNGVLDARGRVMLKLNVTAENKDAVLAVLPSMKSPTINDLSGGGYAVESVVEKKTVNLVIPALREAGATDLVEMPISKIVP
jgi:ATP phosphoribosyltransferase